MDLYGIISVILSSALFRRRTRSNPVVRLTSIGERVRPLLLAVSVLESSSATGSPSQAWSLSRNTAYVAEILEHIESSLRLVSVIQVLSRNNVASVGLVQQWLMTGIKCAGEEISTVTGPFHQCWSLIDG